MTDQPSSLADEYMSAERAMARLYDGARLRRDADDVLAQLPCGSLLLLASTTAGAGLAATCAALRTDQTAWSRVNLSQDEPLRETGTVVFVEPIEPEAGWLSIMRRWHADALVVWPLRSALAVAA
jgi:hypothetical protein